MAFETKTVRLLLDILSWIWLIVEQSPSIKKTTLALYSKGVGVGVGEGTSWIEIHMKHDHQCQSGNAIFSDTSVISNLHVCGFINIEQISNRTYNPWLYSHKPPENPHHQINELWAYHAFAYLSETGCCIIRQSKYMYNNFRICCMLSPIYFSARKLWTFDVTALWFIILTLPPLTCSKKSVRMPFSPWYS